jgi:hypothetical protein
MGNPLSTPDVEIAQRDSAGDVVFLDQTTGNEVAVQREKDRNSNVTQRPHGRVSVSFKDVGSEH